MTVGLLVPCLHSVRDSSRTKTRGKSSCGTRLGGRRSFRSHQDRMGCRSSAGGRATWRRGCRWARRGTKRRRTWDAAPSRPAQGESAEGKGKDRAFSDAEIESFTRLQCKNGTVIPTAGEGWDAKDRWLASDVQQASLRDWGIQEMHRWSLSTHDGIGRFRDPAVTPVPCPLITARRSIQIIVPATTTTMAPYATHTPCSQGAKPRQHHRKPFSSEPESLAASSSSPHSLQNTHLCPLHSRWDFSPRQMLRPGAGNVKRGEWCPVDAPAQSSQP
jgi:hypothetical protein